MRNASVSSLRLVAVPAARTVLHFSRLKFFAAGVAAAIAFVESAATADAAPTARSNFEKHCASCHGKDGRSQTRLGRKSGAKDLTDKAAQAKLTDEDAFKGIKFGRKNSKGEEKMDAFGKDLSDAEITELVAYVRTLAK